MNIKIRNMSREDYSAVRNLWESDPGLYLAVGDDEFTIQRYLERNPTTSFVAIDGENIVGTVLAGHDGRRGFLSHLIVAEDYRGKGLSKELLKRVYCALEAEQIPMILSIVLDTNEVGRQYWAYQGWHTEDAIAVISYPLGKDT